MECCLFTLIHFLNYHWSLLFLVSNLAYVYEWILTNGHDLEEFKSTKPRHIFYFKCFGFLVSDPICDPPYIVMNLQCVLVPTAPTTTVATTTTAAVVTTRATPAIASPTSGTSSDPALEGLLKALELCNNLGGFVPHHLLNRAQVTAGEPILN